MLIAHGEKPRYIKLPALQMYKYFFQKIIYTLLQKYLYATLLKLKTLKTCAFSYVTKILS